ncbi:hypothetical protein ACJJTC_010102 [Scirpophaga incertulas]
MVTLFLVERDVPKDVLTTKNGLKIITKNLEWREKNIWGIGGIAMDQNFKFILHDTVRPARKIGPRCTSEFCKKSKLRGCDTIPDEERNTLFSNYWNNMTWEQRKQYVASNVQVCPKKQVKCKTSSSRRNETKEYFTETLNGRVQVCKLTFLNTFGIKEWTVRYWLSLSEIGMAKTPELTHKDDYNILPKRAKNRKRPDPRSKLYNNHQKLNEAKWKHLQELKSVIPPDCHSFYDTLLH